MAKRIKLDIYEVLLLERALDIAAIQGDKTTEFVALLDKIKHAKTVSLTNFEHK